MGKEDGPTAETIFYNLDKEPKSLDPQIADDYASRIAILALYEGLVRIGGDGEPKPGVAASWEANKDYTVFTFSLRQDARWPSWSKGKEESVESRPITAGDFVFGLQRALDPGTGSPTAGALFPIKNAEKVNKGELPASQLGVTALNDYTLVVDLEYSYEDFPALMALPASMPCNREFFEQSGGQYGLEVASVLGNGPYRFANRYSWEHSASMALVRSDFYKGENQPVPAGIRFTIGATQTNTAGAIMDNTVDAAPLPGDQLEIAQSQGFHLTSFEDTTWGLCFNTQNAVFKNLNVRKSFVQSLDREYVLSAMPKNYTIADDIIAPGTTFGGEKYRSLAGGGFYLKQDGKARTLLETGLRELELERLPSVRVLCLEDPQTAAMVNNMLELWSRKLGYYINMVPLSRSELDKRIRAGDYQMALAPLRAENDGPMEFLSMFASDQPSNPVGLQSSQFDAYLDQAAQKPLNEGIESYVAAEQYLNNQAIVYPLCYEKRYFASAANVTGIWFHSYDSGVDFIQATKVTG